MTDEKITTIHLWTRPASQQSKPDKASLIAEINSHTGEILELSGLTIKDMQLVLKAINLGMTTTAFEGCRTKADYVAAFATVAPKVKTFSRLTLPSLKGLSKVFVHAY